MTTTTRTSPACPRFPVSAGMLCLAFLLALVSTELLAQQNPFGNNNPDAPPAARQSNLLKDQPKKETNPAVLAILDSNPQTIPELSTAAKQLVDLDRPKLAILLMEKVIAANPGDDELADLMEQDDLGSAFFLSILRDPQLQPAGGAFATLVLNAAKKRLDDIDRINRFIDQRLGDDEDARVIALDQLRQHGERAAIELAMRLRDDKWLDDHDAIRDTLVRLGPSADEPLLGMLDAPNEDLRAQLFIVLSQRKNPRAFLRMIAPAFVVPREQRLGAEAREGLKRYTHTKIPTHRDAERFLSEVLRKYLEGDLMIPTGPNGKIVLWRWGKDSALTRQERPPRIARLILAAQAARDLYSMDQGNKDYQLLYLRSILEESKELHGIGRPLVDLVDHGQVDAGMLLAVYRNAIKTKHVPAAIGALEILATKGDERLFQSPSGRPSLLVEAIRHPNLWLRYAALQAIVKMDPRQPYPGSSFVLETLAYFAGSRSEPRVLTGDGIASRSQSWGGMLADLGFASDRASSGKNLFQLAASNPDYEFILIGDTIYHPGVAETVSLLRKDPRTANIPIGIVTDVNERGVGARIVALDDRASLLVNPHSVESMTIQARTLLEMAGEQPVTTEDRLSLAQFALQTMAHFAANPEDYGYYDISRYEQTLIAALFQPRLGKHAAPVLGHIATPDSTQALVNFASLDTETLESRRAAVEALDQAIQKRGLLLNKAEVQQIYDLYNASLDVKEDDVLQLLGDMLDAIEGPFRRRQQAATRNDAGNGK